MPDHKPGRIIGMVGFNTAAYGNVEYFDTKTNSWLMSTGLTGTTAARYHADQIPSVLERIERPNSQSSGSKLHETKFFVGANLEVTRLYVSKENNNTNIKRKNIFAKIIYAWLNHLHELGVSPNYITEGLRHLTYNPKNEGPDSFPRIQHV